MKSLAALLGTAGTLIGLGASSVPAQQTSRIVVTPYAGVFMPSSRVAELKVDGELMPSLIGIRQQSAPAAGVGASYWFNDFAGFELAGAWAFSDAKPSPALAAHVPGLSANRHESARVLLGSAKFMVNLLRLNERSAIRLGVGPAIISRGGSAYDSDGTGEFTGLTDLGGAISLCSRLPLTDFLSLRVRAENYMYSSGLRYRTAANEPGEVPFRSKLQNDFIFSAGLQMVWRR